MLTKRITQDARFGWLLSLLFLLLVMSGFNDSVLVRAGNASLGVLTVIVAIAVTGLRTRVNRWQIGLISTFALASLVLGVIQRQIPQGISSITGALALGFIMIAAMAEVLDHDEVNIQTLFGAMCVYLLLGLLFGKVFNAIDAISSEPVFNSAGRIDSTYFSFTTLTTVGYGDITAVGPFTRRVAIMEGIAGQVFLATAVARLMSLYRSSADRSKESDAPQV